MTVGAAEEVLDDPDLLEQADRTGLVPEVAAAPARLREAAFLAAEVPIPDEGRPRALVVSGSGETAQAGEALRVLAGPGCPAPIVVHAGGPLPGWIGAADLVVAAGEDAVEAADAAVRRGARLVTVGAAGTPLADVAERGRAPHVEVPARPDGTAYWSLLAPMLTVAHAVRLVGEPPFEAAAARLDEVTERCRPSKESFLNPAKALALRLLDVVPAAWGPTPVAAVAAERFVAQLARCAGLPATATEVPSLRGVHVVLFGPGDAPDAPDAPYDEIPAEGQSALEHLACLVATADFTAAYLSLVRG